MSGVVGDHVIGPEQIIACIIGPGLEVKVCCIPVTDLRIENIYGGFCHPVFVLPIIGLQMAIEVNPIGKLRHKARKDQQRPNNQCLLHKMLAPAATVPLLSLEVGRFGYAFGFGSSISASLSFIAKA